MIRLLAVIAGLGVGTLGATEPTVVRSAKSGAWSDPATWETGKPPVEGDKVLIRTGHAVSFDIVSAHVFRSLHVSGTLSFASDKDTRLNVGLIKIQAGESTEEDGFDCSAHSAGIAKKDSEDLPALLVGTPVRAIEAGKTATIRLHYVEGMNKETCPAIVCCGGRMEFHGQPLNRTWVKLGKPAAKGDRSVTLAEAVTGWNSGDKVFLTATTRQIKLQKTFKPSVRDNTQTEERIIKNVSGAILTLDRALEFDHKAEGDFRGEVANLTRNVVVESANPDGVRGHTMYHRKSAGSIGYAEFRYLGKRDVLGKYAIHFHLCGDTMRGSSVVGASIHDSHNRWITVHGTDYLVVRDCVGYHSVGHGFFLEDGTETNCVFDRNLGVQACVGKPLPNQVLPFDRNDGAGFWWANSHNTFTRNVAAECDEYGYRFEVVKSSTFDPKLKVRQADGSKTAVDVRTLPFVRFEDNESHCQRRHAFNLGGFDAGLRGGVDGMGPDAKHPFLVKNLRVWNSHWSFHTLASSVLVDGLVAHDVEYGLWRIPYKQHAYRAIELTKVSITPEFAPGGIRPKDTDYPQPLDPVDDLPPATVITHFATEGGLLKVRGTAADNGRVKGVKVNGVAAKALSANFAEWEVVLPDRTSTITAVAEDEAGNVERTPHSLSTRR